MLVALPVAVTDVGVMQAGEQVFEHSQGRGGRRRGHGRRRGLATWLAHGGHELSPDGAASNAPDSFARFPAGLRSRCTNERIVLAIHCPSAPRKVSGTR